MEIDLGLQQLVLCRPGLAPSVYPVSTARNGPGERLGSGCTPRGAHRVRLKIGQGCAVGSVFRARRWTGEVYSAALAERHPGRDWILTRILWLTGLEAGRNRGGQVDTLRRYIYIHGCPPDTPMGEPGSKGCIRMRDPDLIELFDQVSAGTPVDIR
ncbi:L,D-transpeptidase [Thiohalocapsa marina]|uniref:L,D-transpeptidase n=1 Tax=Thiohalocapsa marina TaxID=424902 RepID=A0A5M8FNK3_9GAMM|nr:L,D-transpeptidase [Thiohalocapsa marina]